MVRICENCGKEHDGSYGSGRFCCKECARSFSTKKENKNELKEAKCIDCGKIIYINKRASNKTCRCNDCLNKQKINIELFKLSKKYNKECIKKNKIKISKNCKYFDVSCNNCFFKQNNVCNGTKNSISQKLHTLYKYCNLQIDDYTTTINNYLKIKNNIQYLIDSGYSCVDICKKIFGHHKSGNTIFKILNIKVKTLSEAIANAFIQGKYDNVNNLEIWHTTWYNKEICLRSSYEEDYANELDKEKINYLYEFKQIKYFDTQENKFRCAIPDFYLTETNTIVEIKSTWTLDIQEMKDKVKAYKDLGYNFKLILEHKETDLYSL